MDKQFDTPQEIIDQVRSDKRKERWSDRWGSIKYYAFIITVNIVALVIGVMAAMLLVAAVSFI